MEAHTLALDSITTTSFSLSIWYKAYKYVYYIIDLRATSQPKLRNRNLKTCKRTAEYEGITLRAPSDQIQGGTGEEDRCSGGVRCT